MFSNNKVILFDGKCNLCNSSVNTIIKLDKNKLFKFTPIDSVVGKELLKNSKIDTKVLDSIILFEEKNIYFVKSNAIIKIISSLNIIFQLAVIFYIIPKFVRDGIYDIVAKNRYNIFGKKEVCTIPTDDLKSRFL